MFFFIAAAATIAGWFGWVSLPWYFVVLLWVIAFAEWRAYEDLINLERRADMALIDKEERINDLSAEVDEIKDVVDKIKFDLEQAKEKQEIYALLYEYREMYKEADADNRKLSIITDYWVESCKKEDPFSYYERHGKRFFYCGTIQNYMAVHDREVDMEWDIEHDNCFVKRFYEICHTDYILFFVSDINKWESELLTHIGNKQ